MVHCKLSSWGLVQDLQDKVRTLRALTSLLSQYAHFLLCFTNSMVCLCEWMTCPAQSDEPCSVVSWCLIMTEDSSQRAALSGLYTDLPIPRDTQCPCERSGQRWAKNVKETFLSWSPFPNLFDHFVIAWGIKTTNIICEIIDFKEICDPCCYCVLLILFLRSHVWKRLALLD